MSRAQQAARNDAAGDVDDSASTGTLVRTDSELLDSCRAGDSAAWDTLVARYERLLFSVALRSGLSREDAADVTQTTFLALLDALATIRDDERLPYWLMTVARRHAWRARDRSRREVPLAEIDGGTVDPIDTAERVAAVHEGLALVGSPCRELLELLYFDPTEPSYSDISQRLGRAIGGLGPMRARCLQKLRALMGEELS